jgi:hypothetical protein
MKKFLSDVLIDCNLTVSGSSSLGAATGVTVDASDNSNKIATTAWVKSLGFSTANTTYLLDVPSNTTNFRLIGSDSSTDTITLSAAGASSITRVSASELRITSSDTIDYISGVSFASNTITFTGTGNAFSGTIDLSVYLTQAEGDSRYLQSYSETDTLDTVTSRDGVTTNTIGVGTVNVTGTTAGQELLTVDGTFGRLFTVTDDLSESLFSVNTVAGLPALEVFADNSIKLGAFASPITIDSSSNINIPGVITASGYNDANWNTAYNDRIVSAAVSGTSTKTLTLTQGDGGTVTASWTDIEGSAADGYVSDVALNGNSLDFTSAGSGFAGSIDLSTITTDLTSVETVYSTVHNVSGAPIQKGTPLAVVAGQTSGNVSDVVPADASDPSRMPAIFIANEDIADGVDGQAVVFGEITGVDTSAYDSGVTVYVAPGGGWTIVKPDGDALIQNLGVITKVHPTNGAGVVMGAGRSNDVPNIATGHAWVGNANGVATPTLLGSLAFSSATYDNYQSWNLKTNNVQRTTVSSGGTLDIVAGSNVSVAYGAGGVVTISSTDTNTDTNNYVTGLSFNTTNGVLTATRQGLADLTVDLDGRYLTSFTETLTELSLSSNILSYRDEVGAVTELDLSLYLDDTNLARLTSGTLDSGTGIATFSRDDSSTFTVDFSALFDDVDNYVDSVAFSTTNGILTIGRTGSLANLTVDLDGRYDLVGTAAAEAGAVNTRIDEEILPAIDSKADSSHLHDDRYLQLSGGTLYKQTDTTGQDGTTFLTIHNNVGGDISQQQSFVDFMFTDTNANFTPQVRIGAQVGRNADANAISKEGAGAFVVYTGNGTDESGNGILTEAMRIGFDNKLYVQGEIQASGYNKTSWDTAFNWGDHSLVGYLTSYTETDPIFTASAAAGITATNISNWNTAYGWGDHDGLYDPAGTGAAAAAVVNTRIDEEVLPAIGEKLDSSVNPIKSATVSNDTITFTKADNTTFAITTSDANTNYYLDDITKSGNTLTYVMNGKTDVAYTFGSNAFTSYSNHVGLYDTVGTASSEAGIVNTRIDEEVLPLIQTPAILSNGSTPSLNTGISAAEVRTLIGAGTSSTDTNFYLSGASFNTGNGVLTLTVSGATDQTVDLDGRYLTSFTESDPVFTASPAGGITSENIGLWDEAYGWGDHSAGGYLTSVPAEYVTATEITNYSINPRFGSTIGMSNDSAVIEFQDSNAYTKSGYWSTLDAVLINGDGNSNNNILLKTGNILVNQNQFISGKLGVQGVIELGDNSSTTMYMGAGNGDPVPVVIETFSAAQNIGVFLDFTIYDDAKGNMRSGTLQLVFNADQVMFNEVNTMDIGDTTPCTLDAVNNGGTIDVRFTTPDPTFHIKYHVRTI